MRPKRGILKSLGGAVRSVWRGLDLARRVAFNLLFLVLLVALFGLLLGERGVRVPAKTALVVEPQGFLVEQLTGAPSERLILELTGRAEEPETLMKPLLEAIETARDDDRVEVLLLDLSSMLGGGLSQLQAIKQAIESFKESGKRVLATADSYGRSQYYLAALADEVYLHPMGTVLLPGYGSYRRYYKEAIDKLAIDWHVFRVGEYKSAVEPYLRDDMSPEARENRLRWLSELWRAYREDVGAARGLDPEAIQDYADRFHLLLEEHGGDAAQTALDAGLVDRIAHRDELRDTMIELVGEDDEQESFRRIGHRAYLQAAGKKPSRSDRQVAVVVATGEILFGTQPPGAIGGDSTAALLRAARQDEAVKAVVLRVDSPGGISFPAELIRREVELLREAGKPVVASMGTVAASGGYWISMSASEIWANPTTITGSIGIYAAFPTFSRSLAKLGVHNDGVGTSGPAATVRLDRELPEEANRAIQSMIERGYHDFISKAAAGRGLSVDEIDRVGRGQVWIGAEAQRLRLVDQLGDLEEAIEAAAGLAELGEDYAVRYLEPPMSFSDQLVSQIFSRLGRLGGGTAVALPRPPEAPAELLRRLIEEAMPRGGLEDPGHLLAYCFCSPD